MRGMVWWSDERLFENSARRRAGERQEPVQPRATSGGAPARRRGARGYARATRIYPKYRDAWAGVGTSRAGPSTDTTKLRRAYEKSLEALPSYENGFFGLGLDLRGGGARRRRPRGLPARARPQSRLAPASASRAATVAS